MTSISGTRVEDHRVAALLDAQAKAARLFEEIERTLIRPGVTESQLSEEIHKLAHKQFGVVTHWHKRIVRAGENTLRPYKDDPADLLIAADDILFVDLGPVFEEWEADFGRTYVLGDDPIKLRLRDNLEPVFRAVKEHFLANQDITGEGLYQTACAFAAKAGWEFGGSIAGHLVGEFPHEYIPNDRITFFIAPGNDQPIVSVDAQGQTRHWILEIHLVDRTRSIGGFYEELLTIG
ncbi:Metallopeptidase family M24 [Arboricoccus pini]|uniref:Metallopeptidase family M24 n=1 Tax=Arboricoccus pini TaxID=1963835 RepID=A0A212QUM7_9PROT|nr:M24 family metallopeptidase [Arboricoccus pini]SNB63342.1 Metallopeptidase family M24 [Arboricoccus pini]